jgi:threonine/homoserine/homoserine lactone efflux protein
MSLWSLFAVGFVLGLTGAMAPGPLLTVTITETTRRGGHVGPLIVLGHGMLELVLLLLIVFGLGSLLTSPRLYTIVAFLGGIVIIYMAIAIMRGLPKYSLQTTDERARKGMHPVFAGVLISLANPYWLIWWLTIGMGYVMFARGLGAPGVMAFFAGHISSDLAWYSFISYGVQMGGKFLSAPILKGILFVCSLFLIFFGIFFMVKGFQFFLSSW